MSFRYLIWDADGTLLDTYPVIDRSILKSLEMLGQTCPLDEISKLGKVSLTHCMSTLSQKYGVDQDELLRLHGENYLSFSLEEQPPFDGVVRICERIVAGGGQNFIVTHRGRESLEQLLTFHGMSDLFTERVAKDDDYPRKPDPAAFLAVIEKYGLPREKTLGVGDRDLDILGAQNAGIAACFFGDASVLPESAVPEYVVEDYRELEAILFPPD